MSSAATLFHFFDVNTVPKLFAIILEQSHFLESRTRTRVCSTVIIADSDNSLEYCRRMARQISGCLRSGIFTRHTANTLEYLPLPASRSIAE